MQALIAPLIAARQDQPGALLPLLHDIQDAVGFVPPESVAWIASALNLSRAEVHGVITFYHHFRTEAPGETVVQICRAEACQSMGAGALWKHACERLQLSGDAALHGATTTDKRVTLQPVYCLGLCSTSPSMQIDARLHGRVTQEDFDRLVCAERKLA